MVHRGCDQAIEGFCNRASLMTSPRRLPIFDGHNDVLLRLYRRGGTVTERGSRWICPESYNRRRAWLCNQVKVKQLSVGVIGQVLDSRSPRLDRGSHK